jgi:O-antigen/teichoic acid export membrane protein
LVVRILISAGLALLAWFLFGIYSLIGIDLMVLALWIYWYRTDRHREGPTRDQWVTALKHIVSL